MHEVHDEVGFCEMCLSDELLVCGCIRSFDEKYCVLRSALEPMNSKFLVIIMIYLMKSLYLSRKSSKSRRGTENALTEKEK